MTRRILFITPEIEDFVQVGGLGAVSAALPRALLGAFDIRVLIPGYAQVLARCPNLAMVGSVEGDGQLPPCKLGLVTMPDGLKIYVLICPALYERQGTPYGDSAAVNWPDNDIRFARLSLAAVDIARGVADADWAADLVHANDWPTALVPAFLRWRGIPIPSLLTVHNLAYQGLFGRESLARIAAPESAFTIDGLEFYGKLSFLKAGLAYADHVTTVSQTYAHEITRPDFGCGLDGLLRLRASQNRLTGILNGIDESWDPRFSPHLASAFDAGDWRGKRANREAVANDFGLAVSRGPLFGVMSRLVHQKGIDLVMAAAETIVSAGGQVVVLGKGEAAIEESVRALAARFPHQVGVSIAYEEARGRRIMAGCDFLLMPSRFEPCGLSQMYAQRFGTLPIAHRTGGLADTIEDGRSGFLFADFTPTGFAGAIRKAVDTFASKRRLNAMRRVAMKKEFHWRKPAETYGALYARAIGNH